MILVPIRPPRNQRLCKRRTRVCLIYVIRRKKGHSCTDELAGARYCACDQLTGDRTTQMAVVPVYTPIWLTSMLPLFKRLRYDTLQVGRGTRLVLILIIAVVTMGTVLPSHESSFVVLSTHSNRRILLRIGVRLDAAYTLL